MEVHMIYNDKININFFLLFFLWLSAHRTHHELLIYNEIYDEFIF